MKTKTSKLDETAISSNPVLSDSFCGAVNITNDRCYRLGYLCQNCEYLNPQNVR